MDDPVAVGGRQIVRDSVLTEAQPIALPLELVTKVLRNVALTHAGRRPTMIIRMLCLGKVHQSALECVLFDTVLLGSPERMEILLQLVEQRSNGGRPIRVRALSVSGHDGTGACVSRFLDLVRLLSPGLRMLQAGPGFTRAALLEAEVPELYMDDYAGGWFFPLTVPPAPRSAVTSLWLGPFPANMGSLDGMIGMLPNLRKLGLIFMPCNPGIACRILDICAAHGVAKINFVVQEWTQAGTLVSSDSLRSELDAHVAGGDAAIAYTVTGADPNRWNVGPNRTRSRDNLWLSEALGEIDLGTGLIL